MLNMDRFEVRAYYGENDNPGRFPPGEEAFHAWATCPVAHQMEIEAAKSRPEIGRIEARVLRDWQPWQTVFHRLAEHGGRK